MRTSLQHTNRTVDFLSKTLDARILTIVALWLPFKQAKITRFELGILVLV